MVTTPGRIVLLLEKSSRFPPLPGVSQHLPAPIRCLWEGLPQSTYSERPDGAGSFGQKKAQHHSSTKTSSKILLVRSELKYFFSENVGAAGKKDGEMRYEALGHSTRLVKRALVHATCRFKSSSIFRTSGTQRARQPTPSAPNSWSSTLLSEAKRCTAKACSDKIVNIVGDQGVHKKATHLKNCLSSLTPPFVVLV